MAQKNSTDETLATLDNLIAKVLARISLTPDYIEMTALQKARAAILAASHRKTETFIDDQTGEQLMLVPTGNFGEKAPSQLEASKMALGQAGEPLTTPQMVERVRALGGKVGGHNPNVNLGSTLSRSEEFKSVRWKGESAWWFKAKPLPALQSNKEAAE